MNALDATILLHEHAIAHFVLFNPLNGVPREAPQNASMVAHSWHHAHKYV